MNRCPNCGLQGIPTAYTRCPQCDTDLVSLTVRESLPGTRPQGRQKPRKQIRGRIVGGLLLALLVILALTTLKPVRQNESPLSDRERVIAQTRDNSTARLHQPVTKEENTARADPPHPAVQEAAPDKTAAEVRKHPIPLAPRREVLPAGPSPSHTALNGTVVGAQGASVSGPKPKTERETGAASTSVAARHGSEATESSDELTYELTQIPPLQMPPPSSVTPANPPKVDAHPSRTGQPNAAPPSAAIRQRDNKDLNSTPRKASLATPPPGAIMPAQPAYQLYDAHDTDTYYSIARKFYGSGHYYPVLMEHNPEIGLYRVGEGVQLKILKDAGRAREIFRKIVRREGGKRIWYYTVVAGDTQESIAAKFYKTDDRVKRLLQLNPGIKLRPGARLRVQLE